MSIGISLGWNCSSASNGVNTKLRKSKSEGYKTCPFDIMNSNYSGIIQCLNEDFKYFTDLNYLKLVIFPSTEKFHEGDTIIMNTRYGFLFNHESPGHADLYKKENWPEGKDHYINNDFKHFIERYNRRIQNFRNYIHSGESIIFLINRPQTDFTELYKCIQEKYPSLTFIIYNFFNNDNYPFQGFIDIHKQMGLNEDDEEILFVKKTYLSSNTDSCILSKYSMDDLVFVVVHHSTSTLYTDIFIRCLESIRRLYPTNRISVCKTSTTTIDESIQSKYNIDIKNTICDGSSIYGGICHIINESISHFILMHDSMVLLKKLPSDILYKTIYPLWYFTTDRENHQESIYNHLKDVDMNFNEINMILFNYINYSTWRGYFGACFGGTIETLQKIHTILKLDTYIHKYIGRTEGMCAERFIPVLIDYLKLTDGDFTYSLNGDITNHPYQFGNSISNIDLDTILSINYDSYMFKTWHARI